MWHAKLSQIIDDLERGLVEDYGIRAPISISNFNVRDRWFT